MALTESHPARPGGGDPPTAETPGTSRRGRWRRPVLLGTGALLATAVVVLAILAGTYQPVQFGDSYGGSFPGLTAGTGLRDVNTFGGATGEIYVPPQSGAFSVMPSIVNDGPEAVTIEAISILAIRFQPGLLLHEPSNPSGPGAIPRALALE